MRERRRLVAVSEGRLELEALNAPENGARGGEAASLPRPQKQQTEAPLRGDGEVPGKRSGAEQGLTRTAGGAGAEDGAMETGVQGQGSGAFAKTVYSDWGVCGALGWRRRKLVGVRRGLARGVDWDVADGEVGMLGAWCAKRGLDVSRLARAGGQGLVSVEVMGFVQNRQLVLARRFGDGVVCPVRVRDAGAFRRGDVFECRDGALVGAWPRRDW